MRAKMPNRVIFVMDCKAGFVGMNEENWGLSSIGVRL